MDLKTKEMKLNYLTLTLSHFLRFDLSICQLALRQFIFLCIRAHITCLHLPCVFACNPYLSWGIDVLLYLHGFIWHARVSSGFLDVGVVQKESST